MAPPHVSDPAAVAPGRTSAGVWARRVVAALGGVAALVLVALALAWLALQWFILPNLDRWRSTVEQQVSSRVGLPVKIGALRGRTEGWQPVFEVDDVVLSDQGKREVLRVRHASAVLATRSFTSFQPHFDRLTIDGANVEVRRDAEGRVHVAGIDMAQADRPGARDPRSGADWLFSQRELSVTSSSVRWLDERRQAPAIVLEPVDLRLSHEHGRHGMRLEATPPASWGDRFSVLGEFTRPFLASPGEWQRWSGTLKAQLPRADVEQLRRYVNLPFELNRGRGSLNASLDVTEGLLTGAAADVMLRDVDVRVSRELEPLDIDQLQGRLVAKRQNAGREGDRTDVSLEGLTFATRQGHAWPRGDIRLRLEGPPAQPRSGELSAQTIDLSVLSLVATRLPLAPVTRQLLTQMAPRGLAQRFQATWQGPLDTLDHWRLQAGVQGLVLQPDRVPLAAKADDQVIGRPGIQGANVDFDMTQSGGRATVAMHKGTLSFPGIFERPTLNVDRLKAEVDWTVSSKTGHPSALPNVAVTARSLHFENADAAGVMQGTWRNGSGQGFGAGRRYPGVLDLQAKLQRGHLPAVARYLPLGVEPDVRRYVGHAFSDGRITDATARVRGELWRFPFRQGEGEFRLVGDVDGVHMNIAPDLRNAAGQPRWPELDRVAGRVTFERTSMSIEGATGYVEGVPLSNVRGGVNDFANDPTLAISGTASGPLTDMLRYVDRSPVGRLIGQALQETTATGGGRLDLSLRVPLQHVDRTTVRGLLHLDGNDLRIRPDVPAMRNARGVVEFTEKILAVHDAQAQVLGGPARFSGGTRPDGSLHFEGEGVISAEGLAGATRELGEVARLGASMHGTTPYRLALTFVGPQPAFELTTDLRGMRVDAPHPMGKAADVPMPLRVTTRLLPARAGDGPAPRDVLRIEMGSLFQAHYVRELGEGEPRVLAGGVGVGADAPQPDTEVRAIVQAVDVDADAWRAWVERHRFLDPPASTSQTAGRAPTKDLGYMPSAIAMTAQRLTVDARALTNVTAGITRQQEDGAWRASLDADQVEGYVQWRPAARGASAHILARLTRLDLPSAVVDRVESLLTDESVATPPALDIIVDDLKVAGRALGRVELHAARERVGDHAQAWRLNRLHVSTPEAELNGTGHWGVQGDTAASRRAVLDFELQLNDSGAYLSRFGIPGVIRGGEGRLVGKVSWAGSPLSWHVPSLQGQLYLDVASGQFLKANAGAARLLGVLSLQSLPRRLLLDFRDVFAEGFVFDSVRGDIRIQNGMASTDNLRMRGLQASVLMQGRADIARETQDLQVWVVPEINAGAASLAYAAVNPAIGIGTFLAQLFLRRPLMEAGTRQFRVTGPWSEPQVEPVARTAGARVPDLEEDLPAEPHRRETLSTP